MPTTWHPLSAKVGTNFADMLQSLVDSGHGVCLFICFIFLEGGGALGSIVVKALCYNMEGRRFETQ
jgi:hypothetical protein